MVCRLSALSGSQWKVKRVKKWSIFKVFTIHVLANSKFTSSSSRLHTESRCWPDTRVQSAARSCRRGIEYLWSICNLWNSHSISLYLINFSALFFHALQQCIMRTAPLNSVKHHHHHHSDVATETVRKIALETNSITDSYETDAAAAAMTMQRQRNMDNHESFLICPGRQAVKLSSTTHHDSVSLTCCDTNSMIETMR